MNEELIAKILKQNQELIDALKDAGDKKPKTKKGKSKPKKQSKPKEIKPTIPYSQTPDIIKEMSADENKKRFGILYNADNPYTSITGKAITKFYKDNGIRAFKIWHLNYANKDLIIEGQLEGQSKKVKSKNLKARIQHIQNQLDKKRNPSGKSFNVNHIDKINNALINQLEKLEGQL